VGVFDREFDASSESVLDRAKGEFAFTTSRVA
jgi:hypothetical protein